MSLKTEVVNVTPEIASDWLATSPGNRNIRKSVVGRYASDMTSGKWLLNGEGITFDTQGRLRNGHHRLTAVIRSERSVPMLVIHGVDSSADITYDTGAKRTFADVLRMEHNEATPNDLAAALRWLDRWQNGKLRKKEGDASYQDLLLLLEANPGIRVSVKKALQTGRVIKGVAASVYSIAHFLFSEIDESDADAFFDDLISGIGYGEDSPILAFRTWVRNMDNQSRRPSSEMCLAILIKAWNAWREGRAVKILSWKAGGANPEAFPVPA